MRHPDRQLRRSPHGFAFVSVVLTSSPDPGIDIHVRMTSVTCQTVPVLNVRVIVHVMDFESTLFDHTDSHDAICAQQSMSTKSLCFLQHNNDYTFKLRLS